VVVDDDDPQLGRIFSVFRPLEVVGVLRADHVRLVDLVGVVHHLGENLKAVQAALKKLARDYPPKELAERCFGLYEQFRPEIPEGVQIRRVVREMSQIAG
jgi:hypothetical protein